ncbi:MAG: circadian clock KaiB family protein [Candidatus Paceibacterota bacterium]|jgi:circadian clock protein KaiB
MITTEANSAPAGFEQSLAKADKPRYDLRLYVAGMTPRSARAIANIKAICEENLKDRYDLQVIDIYQQSKLIQGEQIIAVPMLIKKLPAPSRRITGDLSDRERVLIGLDLKPTTEQPRYDTDEAFNT